MTTDSLVSDLDQNTDALVELILDYKPSQFIQQPSVESWSAAQVTEHIYAFDEMVKNLLKGNTKASDRILDEKVNNIQVAMSNRMRTIKAPDFIVPTGTMNDQQLVITKLIGVRKEICKTIETKDLSLLCLDFVHKSFGEMTRLEWIVFLIEHTKRHFHQYQKIKNSLQLN